MNHVIIHRSDGVLDKKDPRIAQMREWELSTRMQSGHVARSDRHPSAPTMVPTEYYNSLRNLAKSTGVIDNTERAQKRLEMDNVPKQTYVTKYIWMEQDYEDLIQDLTDPDGYRHFQPEMFPMLITCYENLNLAQQKTYQQYRAAAISVQDIALIYDLDPKMSNAFGELLGSM